MPSKASAANSSAFGSMGAASGASSVAIGDSAQATQTGAIAIGLNSQSTGINSIAIGAGAVATGSVAVGAGASASNGGAAFGDGAGRDRTHVGGDRPRRQATAPNAVALGAGSVANAANTVSVGAPGNERRITNVARRRQPTDAVNVGQCRASPTGFQSQIGGLQSQINDNSSEARARHRRRSGDGERTDAVDARKDDLASSAPRHSRVEYGVGFGFAHRLPTGTPLSFVGGYGNGGGREHTGYVGLGGEF